MTADKIFLAFAEFIVFVIIVMMIMLAVYFYVPRAKALIRRCAMRVTTFKKYVITVLTIKFLKRNSTISSVELVFEMFVAFYEKQMKDIETWELPTEFFPKGKAELSHLYKWIKKVRGENYTELSHLTFNDRTEMVKYWRASYKTFKHRFVDDELKIEPSDDFESSNYELAFKRRYLHAENDLFDLDTKKATWILERRRFFNF